MSEFVLHEPDEDGQKTQTTSEQSAVQPPMASPAVASSQQADKGSPAGELNVADLFFNTPPHNVKITKATTIEGEIDVFETLPFPAAPHGNQREMMKSFPNMAALRNNRDLDWVKCFLDSLSIATLDGALDKALSREGSVWRQGVDHKGDAIRSVIPKLRIPENTKLVGEKAVQAAIRHMNLGDVFHTALWNSGFYVTFKPAPESVWLDINRMLGTDVMEVSRRTYGLLHSSITASAAGLIIDAILPHVHSTSVSGTELSIDDIPKYLSAHDEHDFIWGFVTACHPRGFNIERSCIKNPSKCKHVILEVLDLKELQICDQSQFSDFHRTHMYSRNIGSMKLADVIEYQKRLAEINQSSIVLTNSVGASATLRLKTPNSLSKTQRTRAYQEEVRQNVLRVVSSDEPIEKRRKAYQEYMISSEMRMYQHYVERIDIGTNSIVEPGDIESILAEWTRDYKMRAKFFEEVANFIDNSSMSVIGLEAAVCPSCGANHSREEQRHRGMIDYIPIDMIQVFSLLAESKKRVISAGS